MNHICVLLCSDRSCVGLNNICAGSANGIEDICELNSRPWCDLHAPIRISYITNIWVVNMILKEPDCLMKKMAKNVIKYLHNFIIFSIWMLEMNSWTEWLFSKKNEGNQHGSLDQKSKHQSLKKDPNTKFPNTWFGPINGGLK